MLTKLSSKMKVTTVAMLLSGISVCAHANPASEKCYLSQKDCPLPAYGGVYVPISPSDGKMYNCAMRSSGDKKVFGQIQGRGNFAYGPEGYNADKSGKDAYIEGKFILPVGDGEIYVSNFSESDGFVSCSKVG